MIEDIFSDSADNSDSQEVSEKITWKRKVRERWVNHRDAILAEQESPDFSDDTYIIGVSQIWADYGILPQEMALFPSPSPFIHMLQSAVIRVMERRNLSFERKYIYAIADPDHEGENDSMLLAHGFMVAGSFGYEMDLPVLLFKEKDEKDFDLFFALRWAKLDFTDSTKFFDFHLKQTFQYDLNACSSYIRQIFWQYRALGKDQSTLDDYAQKLILTPVHEQSIDLWLNNKATIGPSNSVFEKKIATVLPATDQERMIIIDVPTQEVIFSILQRFFAETDHAMLQHVFDGYETSSLLFFKNQGKSLIEVFRECHHRNLIHSSKKAVRDWIVKNFLYLNYKTDKAHLFDRGNVNITLYSRSIGQSTRIDISQLNQLNNDQ
ncbi:MAG: hypothetical protein IPL27_03645 [Lewinellaceae bacterium]|nr:hypothetical protein [Lewinellaceae bacterium]